MSSAPSDGNRTRAKRPATTALSAYEVKRARNVEENRKVTNAVPHAPAHRTRQANFCCRQVLESLGIETLGTPGAGSSSAKPPITRTVSAVVSGKHSSKTAAQQRQRSKLSGISDAVWGQPAPAMSASPGGASSDYQDDADIACQVCGGLDDEEGNEILLCDGEGCNAGCAPSPAPLARPAV